jgi:murein DD-endopeptidase MepM/ murein hydrolase activator NlpD
MEYADVFAWSVDFLTETREGDVYAVIADTQRASDGRLLGRSVAAALYAGRETGVKRAFAYKGEYYNQLGEILKRMFLRAPLNYRRISSYFTLRRYHPILRIFRPHLGIDYAAPTGTPVSAVAAGTVSFAGRKGGFGNFVQVRHSNGYVSSYGHLSRFAYGVHSGARVAQGQVIAYVGMTGIATGPHLDFRIQQNGKFINFLKIKNRSAGDMDKRRLAEFKKSVAKLEAELDSAAALPAAVH